MASCDPIELNGMQPGDRDSQPAVISIRVSGEKAGQSATITLTEYLQKAELSYQLMQSLGGQRHNPSSIGLDGEAAVKAAIAAQATAFKDDRLLNPQWAPCAIGGEMWVVFEPRSPDERVIIEGSAVEDPVTWRAVAAYEFDRSLAINANSPPVDSPPVVSPPVDNSPGTPLTKAERCENLRKQGVADTEKIIADLKEACSFPLFGRAVAIPVVTGLCKAGLTWAGQVRRDGACVDKKIECLTN